MNITHRFLYVIMSALLITLIFYLVRRGKLKERYAIIWILAGLTILIFAASDSVLFAVTALLGIKTPINTMFFLGVFFIIIINIGFSLTISNLTEQNKKIAQKLALLESKMCEKKG